MVDILTADGFRTHISEQRYRVLRQPIVGLKSGEIHHYEWLVRFDHEGTIEGVLRPAELSGVIRDLDLSMLAQAILVLNEDPMGTGIAINLSGASVDKTAFKGSVLACLTALEASPTKLIIELTESWDMHDLALAESLLTELKSRGHPVCLDDVGAGAASIRYLRALPANWLKIDGNYLGKSRLSPLGNLGKKLQNPHLKQSLHGIAKIYLKSSARCQRLLIKIPFDPS